MSEESETATGGDDLRSTIKAAMNPDPAPVEPAPDTSAPPESEPVGDTEQQKTEAEKAAERDEKGRFKKKEEDQEAAPEGAPQERIAPPNEWKGAAKVRWEKLPKDVQQAIVEDYSRYSSASQKFSGLDQVIEPRRAALSAQYGSVEGAIDQLFKLSDYASRHPEEFIQWFAQQRGLNLQKPAQPGPDGQQTQNPFEQHLSSALQEINVLKQEVAGLRQGIDRVQTEPVVNQIESFASDPAHPYFQDVRLDMAALMQSGRAKTLQDAYDMSIWANPVIRQNMMDEQNQKTEEQRRLKAEAARNAGPLKGSPVNGAMPGDEPKSTLREEIASNMRAVSRFN